MNIVHRDLACRNIFISSHHNSKTQSFFIAKIGDLGMAKTLDENGVYILTATEDLPWRQSAPEILSQPSTFSEKSDVWSFGIVLWETYSWGDQAHRDRMLGEIINYYTKDFQYLPEDCGLPKPPFMSTEIQRVMNMCLRINTPLRLTFKEIGEALEDIKELFGNLCRNLYY